MLTYIPLISFLWKLVKGQYFLSLLQCLSLFLLDHHYFSLYVYCSATNNLLDPDCGFYCSYHMLQLKYSGTHMKVLSWDLDL
jgi:hypothetical protein